MDQNLPLGKKHSAKMVAPALIVSGMLVYYGGVGFFALTMPVSPLLKGAIALGSLAVSGVLIAVLVSRIREIRKGEEDDLGNY